LIEIEKCKTDIVYFFETYIAFRPALDHEKFMLEAHQKGDKIAIHSGRTGKCLIRMSALKHHEFKKEN
jgi:hypothetical protein